MTEADHRPISPGRHKAFNYILPLFVFSALVTPCFVIKGLGLAPLFYMRLIALCSLFIIVSRYIFEPISKNEIELRHQAPMFLVASFAPFCLYVFVQWFCGPLVFTGTWPGTIVRFTTMDDLAQILTTSALFIVFYDFFRTRRRIEWAVLVLALAIVGLIATGFYYELSDVKRSSNLYGIDMSVVGTFYSFFINANHYGGYLAMATPVFLSTIVYFFMKWRSGTKLSLNLAVIEKAFYVMLLPLMAVSMFVAKARAAIIWQLVIAGVFLCVFGIKRNKIAFGVIFGVLTAAFVTLLAMPQFLPDTLVADLQFRMLTTKQAMSIIRDFPLFGTGYGTFHYIMSFYQTINVENHYVIQPYNHFVLLWSETGPLGVILFLGPILFYLKKCFAALAKNNSDWHKAFGWGSAIAVVTAILPSLVDNYLVTPAITTLFVFYLAILGRCANSSFTQTQEARDRRRVTPVTGPKRWAIWVAAFMIFLYCLAQLVIDFRANSAVESPRKDGSRIEKALADRPDNVYAWIELGHFYYEKALLKLKNNEKTDPEITKSVEAYRQVTILAPTWALGWNRLGQAELLAGKKSDGFGHLGFGIQLQMYNRDAHLFLILQYLQLSRATPWEDERKRYQKLALAWIGQSSKYLPRPFTTDDFVYLKNQAPPISPEAMMLLRAALEEYKNNPHVVYKLTKSIKKLDPEVPKST